MRRNTIKIITLSVILFLVACGSDSDLWLETDSFVTVDEVYQYVLESQYEIDVPVESVVDFYELCPYCGLHYVHELLRKPTPPMNIREVEPFGFATHFLYQFETIHTVTYLQFETEHPSKIAIWTDTPLFDFSVVSLDIAGHDWDDYGQLIINTQEVLFTICKLLPTEAVVLNLAFAHYLLPHGAIIFMDEDDIQWRMFITESMKGGCSPHFHLSFPHKITYNFDIEDEIVAEENVLIFTTVMRIHENKPEFTFIRRAYGVDERVPHERGGHCYPCFDITIRIYDDNNILIQEITGLRQYTTPYNSIHENLMNPSFIDINFDGYLDMRLFSVLQSERWPIWSKHYHWLWDSELGQFIFNEQLTDVLRVVYISQIDSENKTLSYGWNESAGRRGIHHHVGYRNGEFMLVRREETNWVQLYESHNGIFIHVDYNVLTCPIGTGKQFINITIRDGISYVRIQEIQVVVYMGVSWTKEIDFHLADYNGDGFLDMAIRREIGGSMGNDPHYFWLWDVESQQFIFNETLTSLSDFTSITILPDGNLQTFRRDGQRRLWLTYKYIDVDFILILSEEHDYYNVGYVKVSIYDHISGERTVTLRQL